MNRFLLFCFLITCYQVALAQTNLWSEDFSSGAETTSGNAAGTPGGTWSVTTAPSGTFQRASPLGINGFYANDTGTEGTWATTSFSIATTGMATISIELSTVGTGSSDYARAYYIADGGSPVLFAELTGSIVSVQTTGSAIVSGSMLQIVVRMNENSGGFVSTMRFTDVAVTSVPAVYSRASDAWNVGTTWSTSGFTGSSCGCTPTTGQVAVIGGGFTVDLTADANAGGVDVKSTGTLRYTAPNVDLGIEMGLVRVESGGTINSNGQSGVQIDFNQDVGGANMQVDAGGTVTIQDITLSANASNLHYLTGGGSLTLSGSFLIGVDGGSLTNNMTSSPVITSRVEFQAGVTDASFINNQTLTIPTIYFDDDDCTFTNNAALTVTTIQVAAADDDGNTFANSSGITVNLSAINAGDADLNILNSGTITQTGNITNIVTTANIQNLNGSSWTWSLTPNTTLDAQLGSALDCSTNSNTFTYSGAGDQDIVATTYHHLVLATSGVKSIAGTVDVNGNLTIQSGVTLSPGTNSADIDGNVSILGTGIFDGTGNVNVGGNWSAINAASYVEGTRTTTFDGAAQTINNASGTETFGTVAFNGSGTKSTSNIIDVNSNLSIGNTAQLNVDNNITLAGNWTVTSTNTNPFVEGTRTVTLDGGGAQAISTVLGAGETFYDLSITGAGTKTTSSVVNVTNDLSIGNAGNTVLSAGANITVGGDWTVNSSNGDPFVQSTNTVTFNGTGSQILNTNLAAGETFYNLVINNSSGASPQITLSDKVSVTNALTMTAGVVQTTSTNLLVMNNASSATIGSASSYVNGPMQFDMAVNNTTRTLNFPIGKSGHYGGAALTVRHGSATSYSYTAEVIHSSATALGYTLAGTTDRVSNVRYWDIKRGTTVAPLTSTNANLTTTGGNGPRLQLYYTSVDGVNQPATLTLVKSSGSTGTPSSPWLDIGGTATGSPSGNIAMGSASGNFTYFSYFTLANETGGTNPLPIELLSFEAKLNNDQVNLSWSTASELNNRFFTIERASNIENFEPIGLPIDGSGTTKERHDYSMIDDTPLYGRSYYRLKQTDFDGKFTYSDLRVVDFEGPKFSSLRAYPNQSDGTGITVLLTGVKDQGSVPLQIYNVQGQLVYTGTLDVAHPGTLKREIEFGSPLKAGVYLIKAGPTLQMTQKIFIR